MKSIRHSPEQIVRKLRQADEKLASGSTVPEVARELGVSEAGLSDAVGVIFGTA